MRLLILISCLFFASCGSDISSPKHSDGKAYKDALISAIESADKITVTEHSSKLDLLDDPNSIQSVAEDIEYQVVSLDGASKKKFSALMHDMNEKTQNSFPGCIFQAHHTVRFFSGERVTSTMRICFECGQVQWDGASRVPPRALYSALSDFILSVGFKPKQDWRARARIAKAK